MPKIKANDANIYYELHGKGVPVVLIGGYSCDHLCWQPILDELAQHFQVLIFDNRGSGQTTDDGRPLSSELLAGDIISLLAHLDLRKPHIVGHSMGGNIAQTLAIHFQQKINKICLLSTSPKWRYVMSTAFKSLLTLREKNIDFDLIFEASLPWLFGDSFLKDEQAISLFKNSILENPYPQSLSDQIRQYKILEQFDVLAQIKNIKVPVMVIAGNQDLISLPQDSRYIVEQTGAKFVELTSGHVIMLEQPEQLAEELINFLT